MSSSLCKSCSHPTSPSPASSASRAMARLAPSPLVSPSGSPETPGSWPWHLRAATSPPPPPSPTKPLQTARHPWTHTRRDCSTRHASVAALRWVLRGAGGREVRNRGEHLLHRRRRADLAHIAHAPPLPERPALRQDSVETAAATSHARSASSSSGSSLARRLRQPLAVEQRCACQLCVPINVRGSGRGLLTVTLTRGGPP